MKEGNGKTDNDKSNKSLKSPKKSSPEDPKELPKDFDIKINSITGQWGRKDKF